MISSPLSPLKPPRLNPGDTVEIVAPASPVRSEFFEKGMQTLRDFGLKPHFSDIYRKWRYLAGTDSTRLQELLEAMGDPATRAIFFARGGYGSGRLLRYEPQLRQ